MAFELSSPAFKNNGMIPSKYTCDGDEISPPLKWTDPPQKTKSFALISDDPDAPRGTWVHWVLFNIPPSLRALDEKISHGELLKDGAKQGTNDSGEMGYGGPCPPSGTHRYFFKFYALDNVLNLEPGARKNDLLEAMKDHILVETELIGLYRRQGR